MTGDTGSAESGSDAIVLGFPDYRLPARRLAAAAGLRYAEIRLHTFPDGESLVRLPERLPPHVILCTSLAEANKRLIELELAGAAALSLGAKRLTLVAPYLCYMRQDKAFNPGEAVSQKIIGRLLARRLDGLVTVDPHLHRTHALGDAVPVRRAVALSAAPVMSEWLSRHGGASLVVGPDAESEQWVARIAAAAGCRHCVARKERLGDREVRVTLPELDFRGRDIVLVDDIVSTGETVAEAAGQLRDRGALRITLLVTHALFAAGALERIRSAGVGDVCSTDSVPHESNRLHLDTLLAGALAAE